MKIDVRMEGTVAVVDMEGKLTLGDGDSTLRGTIDRLLAEGKDRILLNLERVPYIDSAGMGELVGSAKRSRAAGGAVKLLNPLKKVFDVLHLVKLNTVFEIHTDEKTAIASFGPA